MKTKSKAAAYFDVPAMNQQAIASQFKEFKTEVANAIREKKGTTEIIHPKDFGEEIKSLSGGIKYYRYDGYPIDAIDILDEHLSLFCAVKFQWHNKSNDESNDDSVIDERAAGKVSVWNPYFLYEYNWKHINLLAFAVDENARYYRECQDEWTYVKEEFSRALDMGLPVSEITEEEFYNIPPVLTIQIYGRSKRYLYEEGMTWGEWVNSEYSKGEFEFDDCGDYQEIQHIASYGDIAECFDTGCYKVKDSDLIYNKPYKCLTPPA